MSSQTVFFNNPADIVNLQSSTVSLSGAVNTLNLRTSIQIATGSFTAVANYTYQYLLPVRLSGATTVACTLPLSPVDGDSVTIIDSNIVLQGWGNTIYSCRVLGNGREIQGACSSSASSFGDLYNYRGCTITFVYSSSLNAWIGQSQKNFIKKEDDPLTGWWERITKANLNQRAVYVNIDATRYPIFFSQVEGVNRETFIKNNLFSITYYLVTGSIGGDINQRTYATVSSRFYLEGTGTFSGGSPTLLSFCGQTLDYIYTINAAPKWVDRLGPITVTYRRINTTTNTTLQSPIEDMFAADNNGGAFLNQSLYDPIFMIKKIFAQAEAIQAHLNSNISSYAPDYYTRKGYVTDLCSQGVTFSVPVSMVRKSHIYTGANLYPALFPAYTGGSTKLTDICCAYSQYCTPGSNVTLSGFANSWTGLNGYYPNGVSAHALQINKENANRIDFKYGDSFTYNNLSKNRVFTESSTGSALSWVNRFMLIKDTSDPSYEAETTGPYKGYGVNIGTPTVSVTHRVYSEMPPNEWLAAFVASCKYLFNNGVHMRPFVYYTTPQGQLITEWSQLSLSSTMATRTRVKGGEFSPTTPINSSFFQRLREVNVANPQGFSLTYLGGEINDPYQLTDFINNYVTANAPTSNDNILTIPMLNYCETGAIKNLYFAFDGNAPTTTIQRAYSNSIRTMNFSNPSITGGSTVIGGLFDYRLPFTTGAYVPHYTNPAAPTSTIWRLSSNMSTSNTNSLVFAKIRSELVGGKTVFYIRASDWTDVYAENYGIISPDMAPAGYTGPSDLVNNKFFGCYAAELQHYATVAKWMNSFTNSTGGYGPDAIIIDQRNNKGGYTALGLLHMIGGDRPIPYFDTNFIDDGYSPKLINQYIGTGSNAFWSVTGASRTFRTFQDIGHDSYRYLARSRPSQLELNFGPEKPYIVNGISYTGSSPVIKNCNIVFLSNQAAGSMGELFPSFYFGTNGDRNIGNGCKVNIIGERSPGNYGAATADLALTRPLNSRRFDLSSFPAYSFDTSIISPFTEGYSGSLVGFCNAEEIPVWNYNHVPIGPVTIAGVAATGALRNDISIPLYDLGFLTPDNPNYYIAQSRAAPIKTDASTWRDSWLEQALKQAQYM